MEVWGACRQGRIRPSIIVYCRLRKLKEILLAFGAKAKEIFAFLSAMTILLCTVGNERKKRDSFVRSARLYWHLVSSMCVITDTRRRVCLEVLGQTGEMSGM